MGSPLIPNRFRRALAAITTVSITQWGMLEASAESWLFDFGGAGAITTNGAAPLNDPVNFWNNVNEGVASSSMGTLLNLVTKSNVVTNVDLLMVSRFGGVNTGGTTASTLYPRNATSDSFYGNTGDFSGLSNLTPIFKMSALDPLLSYTFKFYASRTNAGGDNRETLYTLTGSVSGSAALNVSENVNNFVTVSNITPDLNGEITISLTPGPNNNNGGASPAATRFIYLGVMEMESVPEPSAAVALGAGAMTLVLRRRRLK